MIIKINQYNVKLNDENFVSVPLLQLKIKLTRHDYDSVTYIRSWLQHEECTNSTLIEPLATTCVTNNFVAFSAAADDAAKCVSTITTALQGFDVVEKCLPTLTCGDITSIAYYAARVCSEQLLEFQAHTNCSTLCGVATCYATAASEVSSCSVDDFEQTITDNAVAWQSATSETQTEMCCPLVGVVFNMEVTVYAMALVTGVFLKLFSMT
ncbi:unnamed protein product [Mytilus coruscus]|uniref:Uncharacterized protein n=1 Tax=Mytilus coruscus TaxID=42192 RepID=A0A6J8F1G8_MYTCO|nr:unnamed protein product [Mytilus coruscus]